MIPFKKHFPGIAWFFLVLILICLPGKDLPKTGSWFELIYFDKWIHTGLFGVLSFLWIYPIIKADVHVVYKKKWALKILFAGIVWGITTELIQKYFIVGREFDLLDWAADSAGVLLAYLFCIKIVKP